MKKKANEKGKASVRETKWENFRNVLKGDSKKNIVWRMLFSLLMSTCFFTYVNAFINKIMPRDELVVTINEPSVNPQGSEVWIYLIDNTEISKEQFDAMEKTGGWEFRSREEWNYGNNVILGKNKGSSITIPIVRASNGGISVWCRASSGGIDTDVNGEVKHYDLFSEEGAYIQIMPFEDSFISILVTIVVYLILAFFVMILLLLMLSFFQHIYVNFKEPQYEYWTVVLVLFIGTYLFDVIWYRKGIVNFNAFGDQTYYWEVGGAFAQIGLTRETIVEGLKSIACFRGYGNFVPSFIAQFIGNRLHVDAYIVYFLFPSLTNAVLFGYILPRIYEIFHGKKVFRWQILMALCGFMILYKGQLVGILGDFYGLTLYLAGALYAILIFRTGKRRYALASGACFSLCLTIRTSYLIGVVLLIFLMAIVAALNFMGKLQENNIYMMNKMPAKRVAGIAIAFMISFLCVCIPQVYINGLQGHRGLFAYDKDGAYGTQSTTLLEQSADYALRGYLAGYPYSILDKQIHSIRQGAGYRDDKEMTMAQCFDAYAKSPVDTLAAILKRAFVMADAKTNILLPDEKWYAHTKYYMFSTINYVFIATALFTFLNKRLRRLLYKKAELLFWGVILIGPIAPLLAAKVEWREAIVGYLFYISYVCVFCFAGSIYDEEKKRVIRESNFFPFLTCTVLIFHTVSLTMYHY